MTKKGEDVIQATLQVQALYASGRYISSSELTSIHYTIPGFWSTFAVVLDSYAGMVDLFTAKRLLKKLGKDAYRIAHNEKVVELAQSKSFEIEGRLLDRQQIEAVVVTEDAQLVMAAAGSGKTLSLLAKCKYLVEELKIPSHRILTISFTRDSAGELAERLSNLGIKVDGKTFHALGNAILGADVTPNIITQPQQHDLINRIIKEKIKSDESFARRYNDYLLNYFTMPSLPIDSRTLEELVRRNKTFKTQTLKQITLDKSVYSKDKATYRGEKVRSKEEQIIANYLFINNIAYEYEKPFPGYSGYKPDFTITKFGEPIYLEHQGVDRQGRTRQDIDAKEYRKKMEWNRNYHANGGTRLVETFSYEFQEGTVLDQLEKRLKGQGIEIVRRQESEIHKLIKDSYGFDVKKFNELLSVYLGLLKTSEMQLGDVYARVKKIQGKYQAQRTLAFLSLFEEIFTIYEASLRSSGAIDFSDMIVRAAEKLPSIPVGMVEYDYILVDEVQDLSGARYRLLKALLDRVPTSKLSTVGDDWQSIFRFAGSDLSLLEDFESRFERTTYQSVIEQTHRFNDPLLGVTTKFIKQNPGQARKNPYSSVSNETEIRVNSTASYENDAVALDGELKHLVDDLGLTDVKKQVIYLLGRYKFDVKRVLNTLDFTTQFRALNEDESEIEWTDSRSGLCLSLTFKTMHSSKGLTCDYAFILNGNGGVMGIPSERDNDPVVHMLLAHEDAYPNAEERRLFYVAMTRAKRATIILSEPGNVSPFVDELSIESYNVVANNTSPRCPKCKSGNLTLRKGPYGEFWGCSNFGYGCKYSANDEARQTN